MQRILLTGGAGFIGSSLTEVLLKEGHEITAIDNFSDFYSPEIKEKNIAKFKEHLNYKLYRIDIVNLKELYSLIKGDFDVIIHLAAKGGVRPSIVDPLGYEVVNVQGTLNMLELARSLGVKQFIFASSSSVYGQNPNVPWNETDVVDMPISPYAATKKSAELHGSVYSHLYGIRFIALRLFTVYGPKQRPDLAISKFARQMMQKETLSIYGTGETMRDYTYIDDVVLGLKAAMDYKDSNFEVINIGNSYTVSVSELLKVMGRIFQMEPKVIFESEQAGDVHQTYADISKAKKLLNYNPTTSLEAGLLKFRDWIYKESNK